MDVRNRKKTVLSTDEKIFIHGAQTIEQIMKLTSSLTPSGCMVNDASCVSIIVILRNFNKYKASLPNRSKLQHQCYTVLVNKHITPGSTIALSYSKLATAYGITHIEVHKCHLTDGGGSPLTFRVGHKTKIDIVSVQSTDFFQLSSDLEQIRLGGLEQELQQLIALIEFNRNSELSPAQRNIGVLLHGPPGCGKTSLGRALAQSCNAAFLNVESADIIKAEFGAGAEALQNIFRKTVSLTDEGPVILFLDELDMLCPSSTASMGSRQLTSTLVSEMDKLNDCCISGLLVVAATNAISCVNPVLRRPGRFNRELLLNVPTKLQRKAILRVQTETMMLVLADDVHLADVAMMTPGFVGADLQALCEESVNQAHSRLALVGHTETMENPHVAKCDFITALHKVSPSLKKGLSCHVDLKGVLWEDIGGLEDVKAEIQQSIQWPLLHPEALRRMDLSATKGVLLYGPPGCCKTTLVRAAATSSHVTFLSLSGAQVYSPYVGESERIISEAFQKARALSPAILFFDEIDSLVGKRSSSGGQSRVQERILATMLNEMDGIGTRLDKKTGASKQESSLKEEIVNHAKAETIQGQASFTEKASQPQGISESWLSDIDMSRVIVIGATNRPDMLDPAILRPGRLDRHVYVPPPDTEGRKSILKIQVSKMSTSDLDIDYISAYTEYFSGADIKNLCREAAMTAVRESNAEGKLELDTLLVKQHHFITALDTVKPSLSQSVLRQYTSHTNPS